MTEKKQKHNKQSIIGKTQLNELNILSLNVCGLTSKMECPEFIDHLNQCDLIGLQETKTDDADTYIDIPGYKMFFHNRSCLSRYRSDGIVLVVKESLLPYFKIDQSKSSKHVLMFTISHVLFNLNYNSDDIKCGNVYIPPQGTKYAPEDPYLEIQEELYKYTEDNRNILLFWDFNSRCKNLVDLIKSDE